MGGVRVDDDDGTDWEVTVKSFFPRAPQDMFFPFRFSSSPSTCTISIIEHSSTIKAFPVHHRFPDRIWIVVVRFPPICSFFFPRGFSK